MKAESEKYDISSDELNNQDEGRRNKGELLTKFRWVIVVSIAIWTGLFILI